MELRVVWVQSRELRTANHVLAFLFESLLRALPAQAALAALRAISPGLKYYRPNEVAIL
jgi:hypothetical protein